MNFNQENELPFQSEFETADSLQQEEIENCLSIHENEAMQSEQTPNEIEGHSSEDDVKETSKKAKKGQQPVDSLLKQLQDTLNEQQDPDVKLQTAIDFLEKPLSQSTLPHFKTFWEIRKICLELFKLNITPALRTILWTKYTELSNEARRLKEMLDEQSSFAVEQIDIAIKAFESEVIPSDNEIKNSTITFVDIPSSLRSKLSYYEQVQSHLNLLNAQALRIQTMRKELIKTDMRVKQKNKFFERLSQLGDKVFPKRKELIKDLSTAFLNDVDTFIKANVSTLHPNAHLFNLREEIKLLQSFAKQLTLNTQAFNQSRLKLSECWDKIKVLDKDRKKERVQQKGVQKSNFEKILQELEQLKTEITTQNISSEQLQKHLTRLSSEMRNTDLSREDVKHLKDVQDQLRKQMEELEQVAKNAKNLEETQRQEQKRQRYLELKNALITIINRNEELKIEELTEQRDEALAIFQVADFTKIEKQEIDRLFKQIKDNIIDKEEKNLSTTSTNDKLHINQLKVLLQQRKEQRREIKAIIDQQKKAANSSGLDFSQSLNINQQIAEENDRLYKVQDAIKELELKIQSIEKNA